MLRPTTTDALRTDTSDMIGVHNVFRDALETAPALLATTVPDEQRVSVVGSYYDVVLRLLHAHHEGEDELLTPLLIERCNGAELSDVERIAAQHETVTASLHDATDFLRDWRSAPSERSADALQSALAAVQRALLPHLDEEERVVLPIASRRITAEEWGALPGHALRQFDGTDLWLVLGLVFDHMTADQLAVARAHMPPPLLAAWTSDGQPYYESFAARLRG
jgi:hemerythrin HHE cation binding domain-containing protein